MFTPPSRPASAQPPFGRRRAFTLIELLIVVAIIAVLASIAVPNFLEAQTRAKVSRAVADMRTLMLGLESYRIDHNRYPEGTDNPARYDPRIAAYLGPLAPGYYTLATRNGNQFAGSHFATLTTPVAYVGKVFTDPFAGAGKEFLTYCYRPAKARGNGYILTSFGPDSDLLQAAAGRPGVGTLSPNPLSTFSETASPARLGDISERAVIHVIERTSPALVQDVSEHGGLGVTLNDLTYDPSNGTVSDGDLYRVGP